MLESLLSEEQKLFRDSICRFLKKEVIPYETANPPKKYDYPLDQIELYSKLGLMGVNIPEEYGGLGGGTFELFILLEEMGRAGVFVPHPGHFGATRYIVMFGSEKQKKKFLPKIAKGNSLVSYAQTEPNAGSDSKSMRTHAILDGNKYVLNGRKCFVTGAPVASLFIVMAKTFTSEENKNGQRSLFVIERDSPGLFLGKNEKKMGGHSLPMTDLILDNLRIPKQNLLITPRNSFKEIMNEFNIQRCANAAICLGKGEFAADKALAYSKVRETFGKALCHYQGIQWMLADMAIKIKKARLLLYDVAYKSTRGIDITLSSSMAKISANEDMCEVIDTAMQILGGYGYMEEYKLEAAYRDIRGNTFGGGTPQLLRNRIAIELLKI